jgi:hypothetical protein
MFQSPQGHHYSQIKATLHKTNNLGMQQKSVKKLVLCCVAVI